MDLDSLEKYWPLISHNPWAFTWTFLTGAAVGWGVHKLWSTLTSTKAKATSPPATASVPKKGHWISRVPFKPTELQAACIRFLRIHDDEWVRLDDLARGVRDAPRSDIRQALEELKAAGWVSDRLNYVHGPSYRLHGPGLDFARERKFPVGTHPDF